MQHDKILPVDPSNAAQKATALVYVLGFQFDSTNDSVQSHSCPTSSQNNDDNNNSTITSTSTRNNPKIRKYRVGQFWNSQDS